MLYGQRRAIMEIEDIRRPEIVVKALDKLTKREQKYLTEYYINIGKDMSESKRPGGDEG
jgi:hypothetical protein